MSSEHNVHDTNIFLLLTPSESFEGSIARESADPEAVETLSLNGVLFPASEYESVGIEPLLFQNLCLEATGDRGGWKYIELVGLQCSMKTLHFPATGKPVHTSRL